MSAYSNAFSIPERSVGSHPEAALPQLHEQTSQPASTRSLVTASMPPEAFGPKQMVISAA